MSYDEDPDETIYFKEINPCGILCEGKHPVLPLTVFGHWFYGRRQDKNALIHSSGMGWQLFTKNTDLALKIAKDHIELRWSDTIVSFVKATLLAAGNATAC